jgi:hypothetical protein
MTLNSQHQLIGKTRGDLTIIALDTTRTGLSGDWMIARCRCGNTRVVYSPRFERGDHTACLPCEKWKSANRHQDEAA